MAARQSVTKKKRTFSKHIVVSRVVHRIELDLPNHVESPPSDATRPEAAVGSRDPQPSVSPAHEELSDPEVEAQEEALAERRGFQLSVR